MVIPLFVGRAKSIRALELAMDEGKQILLVAQRSASKDEPSAEDLYGVGTIAAVLQMLKLPDGTVKVLVEGRQRATIKEVGEEDGCFVAEFSPLSSELEESNETEAMRRALLAQFEQYVKLNKKIPPEVLNSLAGIDRAGRMADSIIAHLP